jgi:organic radical activating enzyme
MYIKYAEFHITNVCDISCNNCNKFNNFNLKGSFNWDSVKETYSKWASILTIDEISIVGGEPLTNLDIVNWIYGIRKLWPATRISIATNGNRLSKSQDVIKAMIENNVRLRLSIHSLDLHKKIMKDLDEILVKPVQRNIEYLPHNILAWQKTYASIKADGWPQCNHPNDFDNLPINIQKECSEMFGFSRLHFENYEALNELVDANGLVVDIFWYTNFHEAALIYDQGKFKLRNNDPSKAVKNCDQKFCHSFKDGKLHKCAVTHSLKDAVEQFNVPIDETNKQIINQYMPAEVNWPRDKLEKYISSLQNGDPIDFCKFCPETYINSPIGDVTKKKY